MINNEDQQVFDQQIGKSERHREEREIADGNRLRYLKIYIYNLCLV